MKVIGRSLVDNIILIWGDMHNEDLTLGSNVVMIKVAVQCYWMRKFREYLLYSELKSSLCSAYHP